MPEFDIDEILGNLPGRTTTWPPPWPSRGAGADRPRPTRASVRRLSPLIWGLVPSWAKDAKGGARMINARVETVAEKPAFRKAFSARRCLLPADGFYEWYSPEAAGAVLGRRSGAGKGKKQPFFIHRADGGLLVMAGLYEIWRDPAKDRDDDSAWLRTCTVITTEATDAAGHIHDRMPMIVRTRGLRRLARSGADRSRPRRSTAAVTDAAALEAYAVSTAVNKVDNNDPSLLEPLAEEAPARATEQCSEACCIDTRSATPGSSTSSTPEGPGRLARRRRGGSARPPWCSGTAPAGA